MIHLSLITVSQGRTAELHRLLESLTAQNFQPLEMILIDQTAGSELDDLLEHFQKRLAIKRLRIAPCGISAARNEGIKHITGDWVAFPDDDCAYPSELLTQIFQCLETDPTLDGISCRVCDAQGTPSAGGVMRKKACVITASNVWKTAVSCSFFIRRSIADVVGPFDEQLGVGAESRCWSGEETDWLLRAVERGASIAYRPDLQVFHPQPDFTQFGGVCKAFRYGSGAGRVLRTHRYHFWVIIASAGFQCLRALGELLRFRPKAAVARLAMAAGRLRG